MKKITEKLIKQIEPERVYNLREIFFGGFAPHFNSYATLRRHAKETGVIDYEVSPKFYKLFSILGSDWIKYLRSVDK